MNRAFIVVLLLLQIPLISCFQQLSRNIVPGNTSASQNDDVYPEWIPETNNNFQHTTQISNFYILNDTFEYYICRNWRENTNCRCAIDEIECDPSTKIPSLTYRNPSDLIIFENLNIKIMNDSIIVKTAIFNDNSIKKLEKEKILPGIETNVENLELTSNEINEIENGAFDKFTSLKTLNLYGNRLIDITAEIFTKQLGSTLINLNLGRNYFSIYALDFTNLINLEELSLSGNHLSNNNSISHFNFVEDFLERDYLDSNASILTYIFPKSLSNIKILRLDECGVEGFHDDAFVNLAKLEDLDLSDNHLTTIPRALNSLVNLQYLNLEGTFITEINGTSFKYNNQLYDIHMSSTLLQRIDDCTFCNKSNLKKVVLWNNPSLSYIHENAFGNIFSPEASPSLDLFYVEQCNLSMIPENLLNWYTVKEFGLGKNPFICNCSMAWLINDILSPTHTMNMHEYSNYPRNSDYQSNIFKCAGPLALKNVPFIKLSEKFCKNEVVIKKYLTTGKSEFSWKTLFHNAGAFGIAFIFGMSVIPLCQYLLRLKKQQTAFSYRDENKLQESIGSNLNVTNL